MELICFWKLTQYGEAIIYHILGKSPQVELPEKINGYPVTALSPYCFSSETKFLEQFLLSPDGQLEVTKVESTGSSSFLRTVCTPEQWQNCLSIFSLDGYRPLGGSFVESVTCPITLASIGAYCFYNCKSLVTLSFGASLSNIGTDSFMNCHKLFHLILSVNQTLSSGLRQILSQIFWNIEVTFIDQESGAVTAKIFFAEYMESYDEVAPAHIFARHITGEGFRARQSFHDGIFDFNQYDQIFPKACVEESEQTLCRLAFNRLCYPKELAEDSKKLYQNFLYSHGNAISQWLIGAQMKKELEFLYRLKLLPSTDAKNNLKLAAQNGWAEGSALISTLLQNYTDKCSTRYLFEGD